MPIPLYTTEACAAAYQLHWAVSLFPRAAFHFTPPPMPEALEADGIRVLENDCQPDVWRFYLSTTPALSPGAILQRLKGRLQHAVSDLAPRVFRRNYRLESIGSARGEVVENYIRNQPRRHPMADPQTQADIEAHQFVDTRIDLETMRRSAHGEFLYNLHVVLEHEGGWNQAETQFLETTRQMLIAACAKHELRLSRAGLIANHLHLAIGCDIENTPAQVAVMLLNNLAYAHGSVRVYRSSYYVGTFGQIDRGALSIRQRGR